MAGSALGTRHASADAAFAAAMQGRRFGPPGPRPAPVAGRPASVRPVHADGRILLAMGIDDHGQPVTLDLEKLVEGRLCILAAPGAGKSWTLRRLLEQSSPHIQEIVVDIEGEFASVAETFGHLRVAAETLDAITIRTLGERVRAERLSVVLDLSQEDAAGQMEKFAEFVRPIVDAPPAQWTPALVAIDEAHRLAPRVADDTVPAPVRRAAAKALADLMLVGRKRGLLAAIATQRLADLRSSATAPARNFLIGGNSYDRDIDRAAAIIGWSRSVAHDRIPVLAAGRFVAVGPAFSQATAVTTVGDVRTRHLGASPRLQAPPVLPADAARERLGLDDLLAEAEARRRAEAVTGAAASQRAAWRAVRAVFREPALPLAARLVEVLRPLLPDGAERQALATHLGCSPEALAAALALLDQYDVVEQEVAAGTVRINPRLLA